LYKLRYDSLRKRLVLPFALLGFLVSVLQSGITYWLVHDIDEHGIERALRTEMQSLRNRTARNPSASQPSAAVLQSVQLPSAQFPTLSAPLDGSDTVQRISFGERDYTVLVGTVGDSGYALLYDRSIAESGLLNLAWVLALGTLFMTGVGALMGHRLAGGVARPIRRLLGEISEKAATVGPGAPPVSFGAQSYPDNEIGQMAQALDHFALRLHGFAQRESHFAADVSHELRTPIAVIRGGAEVLAEYPHLPEAVRERLGTIHRQAVRAGEILEAMLLLAREDGQATDPACAIAEVVTEAIGDCAGKLDARQVKVNLEICERPIVPVERSLAYVVVSNLLRNACAHTREGSITVRLSGDRLEIVDTGIGIPEERFPEILDRYAKGDESPGTGLGLSIVARITEMLRWKLDISSRSGVGTHVTLHFGESAGAG
jgi:signal transduction histidine kinase